MVSLSRFVAFLGAAVAASAMSLRARLGGASDCGAGAAKGTWTSITLNPATPVSGQPIVLNATGTITEAVTGGSGSAVVSLDGGQIFSTPTNTCGTTSVPLPLGLGTVTVDSLTCPTTAGGAISMGVAVTLPSIAPSGSYDVHLTANDQSGALAYCVDVQFNL